MESLPDRLINCPGFDQLPWLWHPQLSGRSHLWSLWRAASIQPTGDREGPAGLPPAAHSAWGDLDQLGFADHQRAGLGGDDSGRRFDRQ